MSLQQDASFGLAKETAYGTYKTPDLWVEYNDADWTLKNTYTQGKALHPRRRLDRASRRAISQIDAGGKLSIEATTKGLGRILAAAFGSTTSTAVPGETGVYQQVHTLLKDDYLPTYTVQTGIPLLGGAVQAYTYTGAQCESIDIKIAPGQVVAIDTNWRAKGLDMQQAYVTPSYVSGADLFTFVHGSARLGGTVTPPTATALATGGTSVLNITEIDITINNGLDGGGYNLGGKGSRTRPSAFGESSVTGTIKAEFDAAALPYVSAFINDAGMPLTLDIQHTSTIGTAAKPCLQILMPHLRLDGELPKPNNGGVISLNMPFKAFDAEDGTEPIYVVHRTTDATV